MHIIHKQKFYIFSHYLNCKNYQETPQCIQIKEEATDEYDSSSEEEDNFYGDDILDQMLNKLLHEGAHKEALFKDLLVYK